MLLFTFARSYALSTLSKTEMYTKFQKHIYNLWLSPTFIRSPWFMLKGYSSLTLVYLASLSRQSVLHIPSLEGKMYNRERFSLPSSNSPPPRFNLDDTHMTWQGRTRRLEVSTAIPKKISSPKGVPPLVKTKFIPLKMSLGPECMFLS